MFDFVNRNVIRCTPNVNNLHSFNSTASDFAAAILKEAPKKVLPDKVTICESIYADLEDCDMVYPTWAFVNEQGKINLSLTVHTLYDKWTTGDDRLLFYMETEKKSNPEQYHSASYDIGRLQLSISKFKQMRNEHDWKNQKTSVTCR